MEKARKITGILFFVTLTAALVYTLWGIYSNLTSGFTSFPWWSACVFAAIYFGPILTLEGIAFLILKWKTK